MRTSWRAAPPPILSPTQRSRSRQGTLRLAIVSGLALAALASPTSAERVSEQRLTRDYLKRRPLLELAAAVRARARAETLIPPYLQNPGLSLRREQAFGDGVAFSTTIAGLSLRFEIAGRHGLRGRGAASRAEARRAEQAAELLDGVCELRRLALASAEIEERVRIGRSAQARLEALARDLAALVRSGERAAFEHRQLALSASAHLRGLRKDEARLAALNAELSAWTGIAVSGVEGGGLPALPALDGLLLASRQHPLLRALALHAQAAEVRVQIARRAWVPELELFGAYRRDEVGAASGHGYEAGLGLTLPLSDRGQRDRAVAGAEQQHLRARLGVAEERFAARIRALHREGAQLASTLAKEDLRALETFRDEAVRRYRAGIAGLPSLLEALRSVEAEELARAETGAQLRAIHLALACQAGRLPEAALDAELRSCSR
jgi:outer membrane protein TolC